MRSAARPSALVAATLLAALAIPAAGCRTTAEGVTFYRVEACRACGSWRSWEGTDSVRELGSDPVGPVTTSLSISSSEIVASRLTGALHRHDWVLTHEALQGPGVDGTACSLNFGWNSLVRNLMDSRELRSAMARKLELGELRAEDFERALHHSDADAERVESANQAYLRIVTEARSCPGWKEPRAR